MIPDAPTQLQRLLAIMARLRDPERGCPWDVEQTFATIAPHTIEEAYEVADAIERGDMAALRDELGDLLLQVVFHARMAEESVGFDFEAVAEAICNKLIRRHPHVFGEEKIDTAAQQTRAWEAHKEAERRGRAEAQGRDEPGTLEGVPVVLPALTRALKLQKRAARAGFDWRAAAEVIAKFREELAEIEEAMDTGADHDALADEVGDLLFTCVNLARKLEIDPESALRHGNAKFERRYRAMEAELAREGLSVARATFEQREAVWERIKGGV